MASAPGQGLRFRCTARPRAEGWEARCAALGLHAEGLSEEHARKALRAAIVRFLERSWDTDAPLAPPGRRGLDFVSWHLRRAGLLAGRAYVEPLAPAEVEALEDRVDVRASRAAAGELGGVVPWEKLKSELRL